MFFETGWPKKKLTGQLAWFLSWTVVTLLGAVVLHADPDGYGTHMQLGLLPCPSMIFFHRPCFGCGLTTSFTALLHGDVVGAFRAHLVGPLLYLGFTASAFASLNGYLTGRRFRQEAPLPNGLLIGLTLATVLFGAVRFALAKPVSIYEVFGKSPLAAQENSPHGRN
ncbi:MAG: DUF2752 domain-containing protein [Fimbriimonadaceae bacterium]|nr:DUF2752 domain-containing protein [Fimbriimonadaceae bacterium]QYK56984.1 MAG: DUF2752 domain-containing protein [Fimbriimonadaceae bacterium]